MEEKKVYEANNRSRTHKDTWKTISEFEGFYEWRDFIGKITESHKDKINNIFLWIDLDKLYENIKNNWFIEDYNKITKNTWWVIRRSWKLYLKVKKLINKYKKLWKISENEYKYLIYDLEKSQPINKKTNIINKIEDIEHNIYSIDIIKANKYTKEMIGEYFNKKEKIDFNKNFLELHISNKESRKNINSIIPIKYIINNIYKELLNRKIEDWYIFWISFLIKTLWMIKWIPLNISTIEWDTISKLSLTKKYFFLQEFESHKKIAEKYNPLEDIKLWIMKVEEFKKRYEESNLYK